MKVFAISLESCKERFSYINNHLRTLNLDFEVIPAINGYALSDNEKNSLCDMSAVAKYRSWLSDGIIGCSLSHRKALLRFIDLDEPAALILEDDVILPENSKEILDYFEGRIKPDEVISLFSGAHQKTGLCLVNKQETPFGGLYYPKNIHKTLSAAAYIIGREAAIKLAAKVIPVHASPDSWGMYYDEGAFSSFKILYPFTVGNKAFKSTVAYVKPKSISGRITWFINKYRIPGFYHFLKARREKIIDDTTANFYLCDEKSPIDKS